MTAEQINLLDEFRNSSCSDMLKKLVVYEMEIKTTTSENRRQMLQGLVKKLWPVYLSA